MHLFTSLLTPPSTLQSSMSWSSHGNKALKMKFYATFSALAAHTVLHNQEAVEGGLIFLEEDPTGKPESHWRNVLILFNGMLRLMLKTGTEIRLPPLIFACIRRKSIRIRVSSLQL